MSIQLDQAKQKAGRFARRTLWVILALFLVLGIGYYFYRTYEVSDGARVGTLFKISRKGIVFKTYEGQLHLAGSAVWTEASTWNFSASSGAVYDELQKLDGQRVKCYYRELVNPFPWQGDTRYLVYKVEVSGQ
ncbi:MAG: hypothetical protein IT269_03935 [Saprospiraceae bacterium]|nr:hypothetical protein [Saprospiraceae bacterium]